MDKDTIGVLLETVLFFGGLVGIWVKTQTKLKELEMRMIAIEADVAHEEKQNEKILDKLDSISNQINEIKIELQNKQDRI